MDHRVSQIQYNYMDTEYQAGAKGLRYAAARGLAVVVMEPIRGGQLATRIPPTIQAIWDSVQTLRVSETLRVFPRTPADWALQWVWNQPEVSLVLSGMTAMEHVVENVHSAERSGIGTLTGDDLALIARVREAYHSLFPIPCTQCKYCLPCPSGVSIPRILEIYNDLIVYGDRPRAQLVYGWLSEGERAHQCLECGECLEKCPQGIDIPEWLKSAHEALGQKQA
jgi:hypothetical protein